jgi:hypothetical protein
LKNRGIFSNWRCGSGTFRMNVALSELPDFTALPGRAPAEHHASGIIIADAHRQRFRHMVAIPLIVRQEPVNGALSTSRRRHGRLRQAHPAGIWRRWPQVRRLLPRRLPRSQRRRLPQSSQYEPGCELPDILRYAFRNAAHLRRGFNLLIESFRGQPGAFTFMRFAAAPFGRAIDTMGIDLQVVFPSPCWRSVCIRRRLYRQPRDSGQ